MEQQSPQFLIDLGRQARRQHHLDEARNRLREALECCAGTEDPRLVAELHAELAYVERAHKNDQGAEEHYRQATEMFRKLNDALRLAHNMRHLADVLREAGKPAEAAPLYSESIEIYRRNSEYPLQLADAIRGQALMQGDLGEVGESLQSWAEAKALYQLVGVADGVAESKQRISVLMAHR
jgi:uncharacterized protein HemY